ncbi:hypothetical protein EV198_3538 [Roseivirga ehrenbergii]|nr:hypothetical protein EV198_3538 [Roseivirga ehrenbergii]
MAELIIWTAITFWVIIAVRITFSIKKRVNQRNREEFEKRSN